MTLSNELAVMKRQVASFKKKYMSVSKRQYENMSLEGEELFASFQELVKKITSAENINEKALLPETLLASADHLKHLCRYCDGLAKRINEQSETEQKLLYVRAIKKYNHYQQLALDLAYKYSSEEQQKKMDRKIVQCHEFSFLHHQQLDALEKKVASARSKRLRSVEDDLLPSGKRASYSDSEQEDSIQQWANECVFFHPAQTAGTAFFDQSTEQEQNNLLICASLQYK